MLFILASNVICAELRLLYEVLQPHRSLFEIELYPLGIRTSGIGKAPRHTVFFGAEAQST